MADKKPDCETVLREFVRDIEDTGGVYEDRKGLHRPKADPTWIDLGETYINACLALRKKPVLAGRFEDHEEDAEYGG